MQLLKVIGVLVAIIAVVLAILLQTYSSDELLTFLSLPTLTTTVQNFVSNVVYPDSASGSGKKKSSGGPKEKARKLKEKLLTEEELKLYDGQPESKGLYLALLGLVFNVKKGMKHYGPGGGYEFFAGRDASRAFVSGEFNEEGLIDDIEGLTAADYIGLDGWMKFYHKDYKYVGKLIGRYYDQNGEPTAYNAMAQKWIADAYKEKEGENQEKKIFPPCNSEWSPESGSRVWCTPLSGGIERDWTGVPRQLYSPGQGRSRCACVKNFGPPSHDPSRETHNDKGDLDHPNLEEYEGCQPQENSCFVPNTK